MSEKTDRVIPPERLAAYADHELDSESQMELDEVLKTSPADRAALDRLLQDRKDLAAAFAPILEEPLPTGLEARVRGEGVQAFPWRPAVAALFALAVIASLLAGGIAGFLLAERRGEALIAAYEAEREKDRDLLMRAVQEALETRVSGEAVSWTEDDGRSGAVTPLRTFRNNEGAWCREYQAVAPVGRSLVTQRAIACRDSQGRWSTRLELQEEKPLAEGRAL